MDTGVQIIHCHGYHWVTAYKYASDIDVFQIYDSLYDTADDVVKTVVLNLFGIVQLELKWLRFRNNNQTLTIVDYLLLP